MSTTTERTGRAPRPRQTAPGADPVDVAIEQACAELRLPTVRDRFADIAEQALRDRSNYKGFLLELLRAEMADRDERRKQRLVRDAAFYRPKRLDDFDFDANSNVDRIYLNNLANPAWVRAGAPLVLIGNSGTGKSHLLIGVGTAIAEHGMRVRYTTAANLVNDLAEAHNEKRLSRTLHRYARYDLLCIDEFGYLNLDKIGAKLLFQIFTEREERKAIAIASNAPFSEWDKIFTDERLCSAIVDRLTFNGYFIDTGAESYRLKSSLEHQH